jgi:hypothetical protein
MKYRIDTTYCWYNCGTEIVLMYFINGIPFTFDELPHSGMHTTEIVEHANNDCHMNQKIYINLLII